MLGFPKILGGISFSKAGKLYEGRKPIFFDKTGFLPSYSPLSQKNDQRACRPLDSGRGVGSGDWGILAHVIGLDVRHGFVSVPWVAHVIGLDVGNDSTSVSADSLRDWARCQARLCQRAVFGLRDWA